MQLSCRRLIRYLFDELEDCKNRIADQIWEINHPLEEDWLVGTEELSHAAQRIH